MSTFVTAVDSIHRSKAENDSRYRRVRVRLPASRRQFFRCKYSLDIYIGSLMLFVFSPLILLLWALVKITSKGPGFYRQTRVGLNGELFDVVKLRSMRVDAEKSGQAVWCSKRDNRMTRLGMILRALHLDELPQLFNVARGEMSLIGPRPERPEICEELAMEIDGYFDRVLVKPGITGLSQINLPPDTCLADVRKKQVLDLHYVNETSLWLEFRILLATALRIFGIKGATAMNWLGLCRLSILKDMKVQSHPETKSWNSNRHSQTHHSASRHAPNRRSRATVRTDRGFSVSSESSGEIDLDMDGDSIGSSSGIGSGIGLV